MKQAIKKDKIWKCDKCGKTDDFFCCDKCEEKFCGFCNIGYSHKDNDDDIFCENCYVPDKVKCDKCGYEFDEDMHGECFWECYNCDKIYCNDCEESNPLYTPCHNYNCFYCEIGNCWNRRLIGDVCDVCLPEFETESESEDYDSEEESEDEETKKIMYESLEQSIIEKNYDAIEKTHGIKFNKIKKFKKRFEKESTKCEICYIRDKECEFNCNHKTCLECFCKSYCLEKNKNCPFCKNHIGKEIMCKCV
jgi:hypothetical protein